MKFDLFFPGSELALLNLKNCYTLGEEDCVKSFFNAYKNGDKDIVFLGFGYKDKIFGYAGSYRHWDGCASFFALFDKAVDEFPVALTKTCFSLIGYAVEEQNLRRVSLTVKKDYTSGNRFAHLLGFDFEGTMYGFLQDGSDANLYARLF